MWSWIEGSDGDVMITGDSVSNYIAQASIWPRKWNCSKRSETERSETETSETERSETERSET